MVMGRDSSPCLPAEPLQHWCVNHRAIGFWGAPFSDRATNDIADACRRTWWHDFMSKDVLHVLYLAALDDTGMFIGRSNHLDGCQSWYECIQSRMNVVFLQVKYSHSRIHICNALHPEKSDQEQTIGLCILYLCRGSCSLFAAWLMG
jgi:hypothetical protein